MSKKPTAHAQQSNVKNPNNSAYAADRVNRLQQGHAAPPPPRKDPAKKQ